MSADRRTLFAVLVLATVVRVPGLHDSFYGDEGFSLLRDSAELVTTSDDRFRPVFFTLLYLWRRLGFHGEIGLRLLPLLFGVAQIPLVLAVGRRLGSARLALAWGVLVALSPMLVEFSQELRMYSLVALVALAQAWALLRVKERASLVRWVTFVAIAILGAHTHLHFWLFLGGCGVFFLRERLVVRLRETIAAFAAIVLAYIPNVHNLLVFREACGGQYVVHLPSALPKLVAALVVGFNYFTLGEQGEGRPIGGHELLVNAPLIVLAAAPVALVAVSLAPAHLRRPWSEPLVVGHALCTVQVVLASALTIVTHQYWLHPKYVIYVAPFFLLLVAHGYILLERPALRVAAAASSLAVFAIALARFWQPQAYGRREDWRGAAHMLSRDVGDDAVVVLVRNPYGLLQYYWPDAAKHWELVTPPTDPRAADVFTARVARAIGGRRRVFYVRWDTIQNDHDPLDLVPQALSHLGTAEPPVQLNPRLLVESWHMP